MFCEGSMTRPLVMRVRFMRSSAGEEEEIEWS
jgi:hypothetical protein